MRRKCSTWSRISRRGQVAAELHRAGGAERARQRAAGLRGDADRAAAVAVAHQHGLDGAAVVGVEQRLDRAVGRVRLVRELERGERDLGGEPLAQRGRAGRSSPRSRARRWPSSATPGGRGSAGSPASASVASSSSRSTPPIVAGSACAWPSTSPTPASPRAAPPSRSSSTAASRSAARSCATRRATWTAASGIEVDGKPARSWKGERAVYAVNKPAGVVSTAKDTHGRPTVVDLIPSGRRLYPVGRLDADTTGLILLTDDGAARAPAHPSLLRGPARLPRQGAARAGARAGAAAAARRRRARGRRDRARAGARLAPDLLEITIREGRKRQVRADVRRGRPSGRRRSSASRSARSASRGSSRASTGG